MIGLEHTIYRNCVQLLMGPPLEEESKLSHCSKNYGPIPCALTLKARVLRRNLGTRLVALLFIEWL